VKARVRTQLVELEGARFAEVRPRASASADGAVGPLRSYDVLTTREPASNAARRQQEGVQSARGTAAVKALTIETASQQCATALHEALSRFRPELVGDAAHWRVRVPLAGRDVVEILNVIEQHVVARASGPALVDLDGRSYMLEPRSRR